MKDNKYRPDIHSTLAQQAEVISDEQKKLQSILDSTVDAIITIDDRGIVDSFNKTAEKMFGYPVEQVIGSNIKMLMPEPFYSQHDGYLAAYQQTEINKIIGIGREVIGLRVDGSEFPIHLSVNKVDVEGQRLFTGIIRDITKDKKNQQNLQATLKELTVKQAQLEQEEQIARHVFETITSTNNDIIPEIAFWNEPMGSFSGDMMLSSILPDGDLRIVLCDFTGHGLPAALGAMPVSSIYSAMALKNLSIEALIKELNQKLNELLPTGIFCCVGAIDISKNTMQARIWNAGLPDILLVSDSGKIKQRYNSEHLPVGVAASYSEQELHCEEISFGKGDCFYLYSDGLTEAENQQGEMFGQEKFEQTLAAATDENGRLIDIRNTVTHFMNGTAATDDMSLIEIKTLVTAESNL